MQQDGHVGLSHKLQEVNRIIVNHIILFYFNGSSNKGLHRKGEARKHSAFLTWFSRGTLQLTFSRSKFTDVQFRHGHTHTSFSYNTYLSLRRTNRGSLLCFWTLKCVWWIFLSIQLSVHLHIRIRARIWKGVIFIGKKWMENVTYSKCPWAAAAHKGVKPFLSAASTRASAFSSNRTQSVGF